MNITINTIELSMEVQDCMTAGEIKSVGVHLLHQN